MVCEHANFVKKENFTRNPKRRTKKLSAKFQGSSKFTPDISRFEEKSTKKGRRNNLKEFET